MLDWLPGRRWHCQPSPARCAVLAPHCRETAVMTALKSASLQLAARAWGDWAERKAPPVDTVCITKALPKQQRGACGALAVRPALKQAAIKYTRCADMCAFHGTRTF